MLNPFRIGDKVYLRPLDDADVSPMTRWVNDAEVTRTVLMHRPMTRALEASFVTRDSKEDIVFTICIKANDLAIGTLGLHRIDGKNQSTLLGLLIGEKTEWGKGYGTDAIRLALSYAFLTLNINRVWLEVFPDNTAALRVYEKLGFVMEGALRSHVYRNGAFSDVWVMGLLRDEWRARNATSTSKK